MNWGTLFDWLLYIGVGVVAGACVYGIVEYYLKN